MRNTMLILHIIAAGTWLGAGVAAAFLTGSVRKAGDQAGEGFASGFERMGVRLFNPAGILVALTGVVMVLDGIYEFEDLFVVIGIVVVIAGAFLGARGFTPLARELQEAHRASDSPRLDRLYRRFAAYGILDTSLIVLAIVVMVLKLGS